MDEFLRDVAIWLEQHDCEEVATDLRSVLSLPPDRVDSSNEELGEMSAVLAEALHSQGAIGLTRSLEDVGDSIVWYVTPELPVIVTVLIGPTGAIHSGRFAFGAFMIAPHTVYPLHSHAARETYILLSGESRWWNSDAGYQPVHPGEVIVHEPFQPHAMRTAHEPLLSLWAWQGDISPDSYRFEPAGVDDKGQPI